MPAMRSGAGLLLGVAFAAMLLAGAPAYPATSSRQLVELVDVDSLSASPDGRFAAFRTEQADVVRNSYILTWRSVDLASGEIRDIGGGGDPIYLDPGSVQPEKALWVNGGRSVVVRALVDGAVGLWQADVDGGRIAPLVVRDADVEDYALGPDERTIVYRLGPSRAEIRHAEQGEYDSGILVDSSVDLAQNLFRGASINGRPSSQRLVGYWYVRGGLLWRAPRQRRSLDLATGADRPLGPPRPVPPFQPPNITAAAEATSASGDLAQASWDGATGSLSARMSDGSRRTCADPLCATGHISALVWRPGSQDVLVTFMDREHRQSLYLWRPASDMLRRLTAADGLLSGGRRNMVPCAVAPGSAICVAAAPASPPRLERIDLATGARSVLFDPNAELRTSYRPDVRYLRWKSRDGATAAGVLMTRGGMSPHDAPLYLNYYACEGFLRGGEGDEWPIPALLDAGFAVACVNSVPFTGPQIAVQTYRGGLDAVGALVDRLSGEGIVDPRKIAMGGLSFGSEVTMWTAIHSRLLAAVSISSAQFEPSEYWTSAMPGSDQPSLIRKVWGLGSPEDTPREWRLLAPALNAGSIAAPVLFQLPEQEARRIPELYARLARSGTPTELYAFPDEPHIKIQPRHRLAVYERNLDWFRYWLQDYRDPDPAKAAQYERWDRLRARWPRSSAASATTAARAPSRRAP